MLRSAALDLVCKISRITLVTQSQRWYKIHTLDGFWAIAQNLAAVANCAITTKFMYHAIFAQLRNFLFTTLVGRVRLCHEILAPNNFSAIVQSFLSFSSCTITAMRRNSCVAWSLRNYAKTSQSKTYATEVQLCEALPRNSCDQLFFGTCPNFYFF